MPPESLLYGRSTTMSDIWSYGIVMWEVFTIGGSPYPGVKSREIAGLLQTGYRMPKPPHISQDLYSIMTKCWEEQPKRRPTFQWLFSAVKRLLDDYKTYVNLEVYEGDNYINFDVITNKEWWKMSNFYDKDGSVDARCLVWIGLILNLSFIFDSLRQVR